MSAEFPITAVARLFKNVAFQDSETKITKKTLQLSAEYLKMFTTEAILRANEERLSELSYKVDGIDNVREEDPEDQKKQDGVNDVLDARHLQNVAGILVLDF